MITGTELCFAYNNRRVIDHVSLQTVPGKVLGLIGPNGSGKTTALRMLYGSLTPDAGTIHIDETPLRQMSSQQIAQQLAVVVQESADETTITVGEMVLLGRMPYRKPFTRTSEEDHRLASTALARVGATHLGHRPFTSLSGGERQRVLIARALAQQGQHLLLDEPTNHLDIRYQHEVLTLIRNLQVTTVVVLHDLNLAAQYCDALLMLDQGRVAATGTPHQVLDPALIRQVYGICAQRHEAADRIQLFFSLPEASLPSSHQRGTL